MLEYHRKLYKCEPRVIFGARISDRCPIAMAGPEGCLLWCDSLRILDLPGGDPWAVSVIGEELSGVLPELGFPADLSEFNHLVAPTRKVLNPADHEGGNLPASAANIRGSDCIFSAARRRSSSSAYHCGSNFAPPRAKSPTTS